MAYDPIALKMTTTPAGLLRPNAGEKNNATSDRTNELAFARGCRARRHVSPAAVKGPTARLTDFVIARGEAERRSIHRASARWRPRDSAPRRVCTPRSTSKALLVASTGDDDHPVSLEGRLDVAPGISARAVISSS